MRCASWKKPRSNFSASAGWWRGRNGWSCSTRRGTGFASRRARRSCKHQPRRAGATVFRGKPIIGIVGGIGSGKSFVARLFGELGCLVIDSDALVREAYADPAVRQMLRQWWGGSVFRSDGSIDRGEIAAKVFGDSEQRRKLEALLHPCVDRRRQEIMEAAGPRVPAFGWDTPL